MTPIEQHVRARGVNLDLHRVWFDPDNNLATFPILTLLGQMVGYQQYNPDADKKRRNSPKDGRYYTFTTKSARGVWGLESWRMSPELYLTEGIFDAARLTAKGKAAVALMSNDPKHLYGWLMCIRSARPVVSICDHGKAGEKLRKFGHRSWEMPEEFDLGDAPDGYVNYMLERLAISR